MLRRAIADGSVEVAVISGDELQAAQRLLPVVKDSLRYEFNARTLQDKLGIKWTHVPFRGSAPALNELVAAARNIAA